EESLQGGDGGALEALLDRRTGRRIGLDALDVRRNAQHYDSSEKCLLAGEAGVDRRLTRTRRLGDFFDARAFESTLQEDLAGRIEDAFLDLARELLWRAAKA